MDPSGRPTVLIEVDDGVRASWLTDLLSRADFDTDVCLGPYDLRDGRCPLVGGGSCDAAASADVVLFGLRGPHHDVLAAHRRHHPDTPVVLQAFPDEVDALGAAAEECRVSSPFDRAEELISTLRQALA